MESNTRVSESSTKMRAIVDRAMAEHTITREEYDSLLNIAAEDGKIDNHERILLSHINEEIQEKHIKIVPYREAIFDEKDVADLNHYVINACMNLYSLACPGGEEGLAKTEIDTIIETVKGFTKKKKS